MINFSTEHHQAGERELTLCIDVAIGRNLESSGGDVFVRALHGVYWNTNFAQQALIV